MTGEWGRFPGRAAAMPPKVRAPGRGSAPQSRAALTGAGSGLWGNTASLGGGGRAAVPMVHPRVPPPVSPEVVAPVGHVTPETVLRARGRDLRRSHVLGEAPRGRGRRRVSPR